MADITPLLPEALGTFHAVTTRDGQAVERDGQPFYALSVLATSGTEPLCEIRFRDGTWLLANLERDVLRAS